MGLYPLIQRNYWPRLRSTGQRRLFGHGRWHPLLPWGRFSRFPDIIKFFVALEIGFASAIQPLTRTQNRSLGFGYFYYRDCLPRDHESGLVRSRQRFGSNCGSGWTVLIINEMASDEPVSAKGLLTQLSDPASPKTCFWNLNRTKNNGNILEKFLPRNPEALGSGR